MNRILYTIPLFFLILLWPLSPAAQPRIRSFKDLDSLQRSDPRPLVIFIYTDWCIYCRAMEATTFSNKTVAAYLDRCFYFTKLDAGERSPIRFLNDTFSYRPTGVQTGEHELAARLRHPEPAAYPALFFLSPGGEPWFRITRFISAPDLIRLLGRLQSGQH